MVADPHRVKRPLTDGPAARGIGRSGTNADWCQRDHPGWSQEQRQPGRSASGGY